MRRFIIRRKGVIRILTIISIALTSPLVGTAAAEDNFRIGVLTPSAMQWDGPRVLGALRTLGYREGENLSVDVRSANGKLEDLRALAEDLVRSNPDLILAVNSPGTRAAIDATTNIPIVSAAVADPVLAGFVSNLARPEGNVTGISNMATDITAKRLAILKEAVPSARRIALFYHPDELIVARQVQEVEAAASAMGIEFRLFPMRDAADLEKALADAIEWRVEAVLRLAGQALTLGASTAKLALAHRVPTMMLARSDVEAGALLSYYGDEAELWRRVASLIDRILKGAKPAELPFEQPLKFGLFVNLKTAAALGLTIPPSILLRADEVIE